MLVDFSQSGFSNDVAWDVLIVGSGAVGLALGLQLSRGGKSVLVLEGGGGRVPGNYTQYNKGRNTGRNHRGLVDGRMKALGGTTRLWGGQLVKFGSLDIDSADVKSNLWPLSYSDLAPYYDAAFDFLRISPDGRDEEAVWTKIMQSRPSLGERLRLGMNIWLPEPDFTLMYGRELEASKQLTVLTNAEVTSLRFDNKIGQVSGVEISNSNGLEIVSAPIVVLACGTLENVRMLLRAAKTQRDCGFADNVNIGRSFIDHIHGLAGRIEVKDSKQLSRYFDHIYFEGRKYGVKVRAEDSFRLENRISNCAATINASISVGAMIKDLIGLFRRAVGNGEAKALSNVIANAFSILRTILPMAWRYLIERRATNVLSGGVFLGLELEQVGTNRSYLFLDPAEPPETASIGIHWDFDGREMEAAALVCCEIDREFRARGIGSVEIDPRILARDPAFLDDCHDSNHHMGGAIMARDSRTGVVDSDLKVFGTENLYVLGAAVFPTGSFANPTLTAIAFAMRLAQRLAVVC